MPHQPTSPVGPFAVVDADTGKRTQTNRCLQLATAFARLDRYLAARPGADARVVDVNGRPVPRPHDPLPTKMIDGRSIRERRRLAARAAWLSWKVA